MAKKVFSYQPNKNTKHRRHAKSKTSFTKGSNNYVKQYRGQGR